MRSIAIAIAIGLTLSGCSGAAQMGSVPSGAPSAAKPVLLDSSSKPIIAPTYLYFEYEGQDQQFEVYGRKKSNQSKWTAGTSCKKLVRIKFTGYDAQGSTYTATALRPGASCKYTVTNPHGKSGTLNMYVSSD
jgi:hypothetical protein